MGIFVNMFDVDLPEIVDDFPDRLLDCFTSAEFIGLEILPIRSHQQTANLGESKNGDFHIGNLKNADLIMSIL